MFVSRWSNWLGASALLTFLVLANAQTAYAQVPNRLIPPQDPRKTSLAWRLQDALNNAGCYPLHTSIVAKTDGNFGRPGSKSRQALQNFWSEKIKTVARPSYADTAALIADIPSYQCSRLFGSGICRKDAIGPAYLKALEGVDEVRNLSKALRVTIDNFSKSSTSTVNGKTIQHDAIFPPGGGDPVVKTRTTANPNVLEQGDKDIIKAFGIKSVSSTRALKSLKEAANDFDKLVLSYALQEPDCLQCSSVNDWLYLRNIASNNAGLLIAKNPKADEFKSFLIENVTLNLMEDIRPILRVYRSITSKLLLSTKNAIQSRELIRRRATEMFTMVEHFVDNASTPATIASKKMSVLANGKTCIGFDGSAIYQ